MIMCSCGHTMDKHNETGCLAYTIMGIDIPDKLCPCKLTPSSIIDWQEDVINHPKHYTSHPSGVECIQITEHMNFCLGNAVKYIWRADLKAGTEDLEKAIWYINREIQRRHYNSVVGKHND